MFKISKEFLIALGISLVLIFPLVFAVPGVSHTPDEISPGTFGGDSTSIYTFPGKVKGTEICIGDVCKTAWPSGLDSGVITILDGKVGIGTTTPAEKLHIFSQDIVRFVRRDILDGSLSPRCNCDSGSGSGDETNCAFVFPDDGSANTCYDRYKTDSDVAKSIKYTKETESNDVLRVSSLGNVGINGLSNNYRLYVNGEDFAGLYVTTAQQNSYAAYISAPSSSNYGLRVTGYTYIDGNFEVDGIIKGGMNGMKWRNVKSSRELDTVYTNDNDFPIHVSAVMENGDSNTNTCDAHLFVGVNEANLVEISMNKNNLVGNWRSCSVYGIVPPGHVYKVTSIPFTGTPSKEIWAELY